MNIGASHPGTKSGKYSVREKLKNYLKLGYVAARQLVRPLITLEYATDDFALAPYAKELGDTTLYNTYMARSQNWRNIFNAATGYIEPRNKDGSFIPNFSPTSGNGFVEGDSSQYSWLVPYNLPGHLQRDGWERERHPATRYPFHPAECRWHRSLRLYGQ